MAEGISITVDDLVVSFATRGYTSDPIDVVRMPDGGLTALDNRRLLAAQLARLTQIPSLLHTFDATFPVGRRRDLAKLSRPVVDHRGELGEPGDVLFGRGCKPDTMLDFVVFRCARQRPLDTGEPFSLLGEFGRPRVTSGQGFVSSDANSRLCVEGVVPSLPAAAERDEAGSVERLAPSQPKRRDAATVRPRGGRPRNQGGIER